jgi:hypothetical protein
MFQLRSNQLLARLRIKKKAKKPTHIDTPEEFLHIKMTTPSPSWHITPAAHEANEDQDSPSSTPESFRESEAPSPQPDPATAGEKKSKAGSPGSMKEEEEEEEEEEMQSTSPSKIKLKAEKDIDIKTASPKSTPEEAGAADEAAASPASDLTISAGRSSSESEETFRYWRSRLRV